MQEVKKNIERRDDIWYYHKVKADTQRSQSVEKRHVQTDTDESKKA